MKTKFILIIFLFIKSLVIYGQTWTQLNSPTTSRLVSCFFINENIGWIISQNSIYKTLDGGLSWNNQNFPIAPSHNTRLFTSVHFIDQNVGIISCGNYLYSGYNPSLVSTILWTNDGGINWVYKDLGSYNDYDSSALLVTPLIAYSIGQYGQSKKTIDGGNTWSFCNFSSPGYSGASLFAVDQNNIYFAGLQNLSLIAAYGKLNNTTWNVTDFDNGVVMKDIFFNDIYNGCIIGNNGIIKVTNDGGNSWINSNSNLTSDLNGVSFKNSLKGWAVADNGKIIKTIDGGYNWNIEYDAGNSLTEINFKNLNGYGYSVGENGKILKYNSNLQNKSFLKEQFTVYPNPTKNIIFIKSIESELKILFIEISDSVGKIIRKVEFNNVVDINLNIENLPSGFYNLKIVSDVNNETIKKIIKL